MIAPARDDEEGTERMREDEGVAEDDGDEGEEDDCDDKDDEGGLFNDSFSLSLMAVDSFDAVLARELDADAEERDDDVFEGAPAAAAFIDAAGEEEDDIGSGEGARAAWSFTLRIVSLRNSSEPGSDIHCKKRSLSGFELEMAPDRPPEFVEEDKEGEEAVEEEGVAAPP